MTTATRPHALHTKNTESGKTQVIQQHELTMLDWGFRFFVDSEVEAFKAAYLYRDSPYGVEVKFSIPADCWMVTVFNQEAAAMGISGAK